MRICKLLKINEFTKKTPPQYIFPKTPQFPQIYRKFAAVFRK
jgi:hypothetical protein